MSEHTSRCTSPGLRTNSTWFRLTMFASLYIVQGIGLAYFRNFQKPYLDQLGISPDHIGWLTLVLQVPFVLKIFIGMVSDRVSLLHRGHRKPYIILGLILAAIAFVGAGLVRPDQNLATFSSLVVLGSFSVTLFDSTADGLAIDATPKEEGGRVQGVMVGGRAAAFVLLSLAFGWLAERIGYGVVFPIIGFSMLMPLLWVVRLSESSIRSTETRFEWRAFRALATPRFLVFSLYAVVYSIGSFGIDGLVTYALNGIFDVPESTIGHYGALRGSGAVLGAIGGGVLLDRLGRRRSALGASLLISITGLAFGIAPHASVIVVLGLVWGIIWAFQETVFFALAMDIADTRIAASMFAIMMGVSNLGAALADGAATALSDDLGFPAVFLLLAFINLLTLPVLVKVFRRNPEMRIASST